LGAGVDAGEVTSSDGRLPLLTVDLSLGPPCLKAWPLFPASPAPALHRRRPRETPTRLVRERQFPCIRIDAPHIPLHQTDSRHIRREHPEFPFSECVHRSC